MTRPKVTVTGVSYISVTDPIMRAMDLPHSVKVREGYGKSDVKGNNKDNTRG